MKMTCKLIEASFDPSGEFHPNRLPDVPYAPNFTSHPPEIGDFDLSQLSAYVDAVKRFAADVGRFEREVEEYETQVDRYREGVDAAYENADLPELLRSFTRGDMHREIDQAGVLSGDEVVILLRGDYDRLIHAADEESACVFKREDALRPHEAGRCIHRGCGLHESDFVVREAANAG